MVGLTKFVDIIDWFIPEADKAERAQLSLARNFVSSHMLGPILGQSISLFLYLSDPAPGFACWTVLACIWLFFTLPFIYRYTGNLQLVSLLSTENLAFASLFGSYYYGGVSSPLLPWLIISLLLGFFYLSERPLLVVGMFVCNIFCFIEAYLVWGFPTLVPPQNLATVGWISILSATIYMAWMAIYYANIISMRSEMEQETERHRETGIQLRRARDMAEMANRVKSIFLAKMSHELRTPLNAVIGFSEILLEDVDPRDTTSRKRADLERINAAGKHLLSLVTDVLDLSKIEANSIELKIEEFDLNALVKEVIANVQPLVSENNNRLIVKCEDQLGTVLTDPTKLRQVALNLLSNAAKFTKDGIITLTVQRRKRPAGDWIELQVRDTGIGIAAPDLPRLFQNFGQATSETSNKYGGTGLGLALSQRLCALLGGGITAASELGQGSCFTVRVLAWMSEEAGEESCRLPLPELANSPAF